MKINREQFIAVISLYILLISLYFTLGGSNIYMPYRRSLKKPLVKWIEVEILGAVRRPGVYKVIKGSRFSDLVKRAGGFSKSAKIPVNNKNYYLKAGQSYYIKKK